MKVRGRIDLRREATESFRVTGGQVGVERLWDACVNGLPRPVFPGDEGPLVGGDQSQCPCEYVSVLDRCMVAVHAREAGRISTDSMSAARLDRVHNS